MISIKFECDDESCEVKYSFNKESKILILESSLLNNPIIVENIKVDTLTKTLFAYPEDLPENIIFEVEMKIIRWRIIINK